ncbi:MAG TPA: O-antigen ligase family protein [Chitinophagaceae bacterium]
MIKSSSYERNYFIFLSATFITSLVAAIISSYYWLLAIPFLILFVYAAWQQWQFVFFILILSLPWSVEYSFNSSLGTDLPDEPLMLLTSGLLIARFFYKPSEAFDRWKHPLMLLLCICVGWIIATVPFSTDWLVSLKFLLAKSWYILAFVLAPLIIFNDKNSIRTTALAFLISMLCVVVIVLCKHAGSAFTFIGINEAVSPFFRNHVNYSAMLVCAMPVLIACYQLNKKYRLLILLMMTVVVTAVFFSYARGAWMALLIGLISYWLIKRQKLLFAFVVSFILILASVFWLSRNDRYLHYQNDYRTTIFHTNFEEHLVATYELKDVSTAERFYRWIAGVRMIKYNWLTGYGPNTFYNNYKPNASPAFKTWVSDNKDHSTVHNYFLLITIEQGIPGLLFFLLLTAAMLYYSEGLYKKIADKFYKTVALTCGVMLMMILTVNFLSDLIETDKVGSLFFLCLATLIAIDRNTKGEREKVSIDK